ncbi:DoxX family protein [Roseomonas gilardii]|uniref:DoxX family protein n=1 Tax=Roseomonas gilardii TaxID=257708 RepID=A0ABU3MKJ4_9PROT|nr:DoxX family protein [Roseomonas gilardii]MDT8332879.1 DoxX family protein [Roseomonas gilardii]
MSTTATAERGRDEVILVARLLLVILFLISGWGKITNLGGTAGYFAQIGVPLPNVALGVAVVMELGVGIALAFGVLTRPLALLLALFTLSTALIGHPFWSMDGAARYDAFLHFYKNLSIIGGLMLLSVTGAGRYSADAARTRLA